MASQTFTVGLFPLAIVAVLGSFLLVRGLRVRRRGDVPHCRKCEYPLTGLTDSERCPECGVALQPPETAVVHGERYRRRGLAWAGAVLLLVAGTPLVIGLSGVARNYDWYWLRPTAWVLDDLERAGGLQRVRAAMELDRRYAKGSLSGSKRDRFIELALAEQGRSSGGGSPAFELVNFLGAAALRGELSETQRTRFYEQMVQLALTTKPSPAVAGKYLRYTVHEKCRSPGGKFWVNLSGVQAEFDGKTYGEGNKDSFSNLSGLGAGGSTTSGLSPPRTPGKYTLTVRLHVAVFQGSYSASSNQLVHERDVTLSAEVTVIER